mgnify:FL=1
MLWLACLPKYLDRLFYTMKGCSYVTVLWIIVDHSG